MKPIMIKKILSLVFLGVLTIQLCLAQVAKEADPKLAIYLLIGQSNMAGRGVVTAEFSDISNPNVFVWSNNHTWEIARHPLHYDKPSMAGVGPGLAFGIAMQAANPEWKIGLVPCAVGGTSIDAWQPSALDKATNTHPYDDAVLRIREAMKYGVVKGIIWHQGEANSGEQNIAAYLTKLNELVTRIRNVVGNGELPVVIGELGRFKERYQVFNLMLVDAPKVISNLAVATSEELVDKGDSTHFDSPSATSLGQRFAEKMIELQQIKNK